MEWLTYPPDRGDVPDAALQYDHRLMMSFDACTTVILMAFSVKILP
jgi:hypothetical protein